ncbi:MAG: substrate-binding domain-containing protein [Planctomycetes bacterium]|nr:substrate-binding domain-containing protein [Planctomycetota bacterium]
MTMPSMRHLASELGVGLKVIQLAVDVLRSEGRLMPSAKRRLIVQTLGAAEPSPARIVLEVLPNRLDLRQRNAYFRDLQLGIEAGVSRIEAPLMICHDGMFRSSLPKGFLHHAMRGIVVTGTIRQNLIRQYAKLSIPVVLADQDATGYAVHSVSADNQAAGYIATQRLVESGHRRIACVRHILSHYGDVDPDDRARQSGFALALREAGLTLGRNAIFNIVPDLRDQPSLVRLLQTKPRFTAAFVASDGIGATLIGVAREIGISVPRDLSIAGVGALATQAQDVSAARIDFYSMGKRAVFLLKEPRRPILNVKESVRWVPGKTIACPLKSRDYGN